MESPRIVSEEKHILERLVKSAELVTALSAGPMQKAELAEELDVSKSTVYNRISELAEYDVVERTDDGYRLTQLGTLYVQTYLHAETRCAQIARAADLLAELSREDLPPIAVLDDAEIVTFEYDPDHPVNELIRLVGDADALYGVFPFAPSRHIQFISTQLDEGNLRGEFILEPRLAEYIGERFSTESMAAFRSDAASLLEIESAPEYGLSILEGETTRLVVSVYTDHGNLCGLIVSAGEDALEWARATYEEHLETATPVDLDEE